MVGGNNKFVTIYILKTLVKKKKRNFHSNPDGAFPPAPLAPAPAPVCSCFFFNGLKINGKRAKNNIKKKLILFPPFFFRVIYIEYIYINVRFGYEITGNGDEKTLLLLLLILLQTI